MDPLSAFGLACGVIQVVDFSLKIVSKFKEIYENGSLKANDDMEDLTKRIRELYVDLEPPSSQTSVGDVSMESQNELLDLARVCKETSDELLGELQKLKSTRKRDILGKIPATMRRQKILDSLESRLESYRKLLDTKILLRLRSNLDQSSRATAMSSAEQTFSFDHLAQTLRDENKSTREHITRLFLEMEQKAADAKHNEELLNSLHFPEINCREQEISDAYEETFHWIFDEHGERLPQQSNFIDWLENGSRIYWIHGKAGSGKSTLMRYIWQNQKTMSRLEAWAAPYKLIVPAFFFWASGSPLQKTIKGLLRSLIYHILQTKPERMMSPAQTSHKKGLPLPFGPTHEPITDWTERKLLEYFTLLAESASSSHRICLFVDGLDEFSGKYRDLVKFVLELVQNPAIKCCVSSRSEKPFDSLGPFSISLKLEDYTRLDIENFVKGMLAKIPQYSTISLDESQREAIVRAIKVKAEGVFLWVEVVVESQILMIENDDDFEMLWSQLHDLPGEVEGLYARMLDRIDRKYRSEAAKYLQIKKMLSDGVGPDQLTIFDLSLAEYGLEENMRLKCLNLCPQNIISKCDRMKERIRLTCAGLLEIREGFIHSPEMVEERYPSKSRRTYEILTGFGWVQQKVQFHHRTVKDFLEGSLGLEFLKQNSPPPVGEHRLRAALALGRIALCGVDVSSEYISEQIGTIFSNLYLSRSVSKEGILSVNYLDYIDETLSAYHSQFYFNTEPTLHWCESWGRRIHCVNFYSLSPDERLLEEYRIQKSLPRDFLSFTASWHLCDYVAEKIESLQTPLSINAISELLLCATMNIGKYRSSIYQWRILAGPQAELMTYLTSHGANVEPEMGQIIWKTLLKSIFSDYLLKGEIYQQRSKPNEDFAVLLDNFLKCGAYRNVIFSSIEILNVDKYVDFHADESVETLYSVDTSVLPIVDYIEGREKLSNSHGVDCKGIDENALRIWFRRQFSQYEEVFWPEDGWKLSYEQGQGLHHCMGRVIKAKDFKEVRKLKDEFQRRLVEIYEICAPICAPERVED